MSTDNAGKRPRSGGGGDDYAEMEHRRNRVLSRAPTHDGPALAIRAGGAAKLPAAPPPASALLPLLDHLSRAGFVDSLVPGSKLALSGDYFFARAAMVLSSLTEASFVGITKLPPSSSAEDGEVAETEGMDAVPAHHLTLSNMHKFVRRLDVPFHSAGMCVALHSLDPPGSQDSPPTSRKGKEREGSSKSRGMEESRKAKGVNAIDVLRIDLGTQDSGIVALHSDTMDQCCPVLEAPGVLPHTLVMRGVPCLFGRVPTLLPLAASEAVRDLTLVLDASLAYDETLGFDAHLMSLSKPDSRRLDEPGTSARAMAVPSFLAGLQRHTSRRPASRRPPFERPRSAFQRPALSAAARLVSAVPPNCQHLTVVFYPGPEGGSWDPPAYVKNGLDSWAGDLFRQLAYVLVDRRGLRVTFVNAGGIDPAAALSLKEWWLPREVKRAVEDRTRARVQSTLEELFENSWRKALIESRLTYWDGATFLTMHDYVHNNTAWKEAFDEWEVAHWLSQPAPPTFEPQSLGSPPPKCEAMLPPPRVYDERLETMVRRPTQEQDKCRTAGPSAPVPPPGERRDGGPCPPECCAHEPRSQAPRAPPRRPASPPPASEPAPQQPPARQPTLLRPHGLEEYEASLSNPPFPPKWYNSLEWHAHWHPSLSGLAGINQPSEPVQDRDPDPAPALRDVPPGATVPHALRVQRNDRGTPSVEPMGDWSAQREEDEMDGPLEGQQPAAERWDGARLLEQRRAVATAATTVAADPAPPPAPVAAVPRPLPRPPVPQESLAAQGDPRREPPSTSTSASTATELPSSTVPPGLTVGSAPSASPSTTTAATTANVNRFPVPPGAHNATARISAGVRRYGWENTHVRSPPPAVPDRTTTTDRMTAAAGVPAPVPDRSHNPQAPDTARSGGPDIDGQGERATETEEFSSTLSATLAGSTSSSWTSPHLTPRAGTEAVRDPTEIEQGSRASSVTVGRSEAESPPTAGGEVDDGEWQWL